MSSTLEASLRELRLGGMLGGFQEVADQARRESYSYEKYLAVVWIVENWKAHPLAAALPSKREE